jgi:peptide subunit release factor 1 (eRF1)
MAEEATVAQPGARLGGQPAGGEEKMITVKTIDRLIEFDSGGLPVLSVYVRVPAEKASRSTLNSEVSSLIHQVRPLADDKSLEHEARVSLRSDIERIEAEATQELWKPGRTVAIFACSGAGLYEEISLPRLIRERVMVDATPWVRPMLAVLDEYHRCCVAVLDRKSARTWELYLGALSELDQVEDAVLRQPDYAGPQGFAEHGVHNKAEELAKRHFRRVAGLLDDLLRTRRYELLVLGGHEDELPPFVDFLPHGLRERLAGTFSIDPHTATPADIRREAEGVVDRYERDEERRFVADVVERTRAGGRAVLGLDDCLWAGSIAAVQMLLIQDGAVAEGVVCDRDRWLARSGETCPLCGEPTRHAPDVIDELAETVIDTSGSVEHVLAETALSEHLVGASLRFPLPPPP